MSTLSSALTRILRTAYVGLFRSLRSLLRTTRLLPLLDRRASTSRAWCWLRSLLAIYDFDDLRSLDRPWWTFTASERIDEMLRSRPGARVFEWGSGASTMWLARRAAAVISVEHDSVWADRVAAVAPSNVDLRVRQGVPSAAPRTGSAKRGFEGVDFTEYVSEIEQHPGEFDVIVVDGRAREACLERAVGRIAERGVIVVDNVERQRYRAAIERHRDHFDVTWSWGLTPCLVYPTRTALLVRRPGDPAAASPER